MLIEKHCPKLIICPECNSKNFHHKKDCMVRRSIMWQTAREVASIVIAILCIVAALIGLEIITSFR